MKPGPAISTRATSSLAGRAASNACAMARGLLRAALASSIAALVAKSPARGFSGARPRSPAAKCRRARCRWRARLRCLDQSGRGVGVSRRILRRTRKAAILTDRAVRNAAAVQLRSPEARPARAPYADRAVAEGFQSQPSEAAGHRRAVADDEMVEQANVDHPQCLLHLFGQAAVGYGRVGMPGGDGCAR